MKISPTLLCPSCRGSRFVLGNPKEGDRDLVPMGKLMMAGFPTYCLACLDCGYVGSCLSEGDRCKLEKKVQDA